MSTRRRARETLLKVLYLSESRDISFNAAFAEFASADREMAMLPNGEAKEAIRPFASGLDGTQRDYVLVLGKFIEEHHADLNNRILPLLKNWDLERIARIDRLILWIALAEMERMLDIPTAVSINEALELAKSFSSDKSRSFINGILDAASKQ